ncbi:MAG: hypothetical protein AB2693_17865 [Candidatus Thiodiazotropha sp.]
MRIRYDAGPCKHARNDVPWKYRGWLSETYRYAGYFYRHGTLREAAMSPGPVNRP